MRRENGIYKIVLLFMMAMFIVSFSVKATTNGNKDLPSKMSIKALTQSSTKLSLLDNQETWENYITDIIKTREFNLLYEHTYPEINFKDYIKKGKLKMKGSTTKIEELENTNEKAFLINLDKDSVNELCLLQCEGSIRHYYVMVYKRENGIYVYKSTMDGYINPVKYNNKVHFISIESDFETKFVNAVIEYSVDGLTLKQKEIFNINYTYDVSKLPESITKIIDSNYLNSLSNYKVSDSNIANISKTSEAPAYSIVLLDEKNNNNFKFTLSLWLTSVGYAPNEWDLKTLDKRTLNFSGINKVITHREEGTDVTVCFGVKFFKDESNDIFLLKLSYPFYTAAPKKDGNLILQLYKFNKNSVDEVENRLIEPKVEVDFKKVANS